MKRLVLTSDTHGRHSAMSIPDGDIFIHAGDFTHNGTREESADFANWLGTLPHAMKVIVPGNHDRFAATDTAELVSMLPAGCHLSINSQVDIGGGHRLWGFPFVPEHMRFRGMSFVVNDLEMSEQISLILPNANVLVCHCPPSEVFSRARNYGNERLRAALPGIDWGLLVCGHIHEAWGVGQIESKLVVNASAVDRRMIPRRPVRIVDFYDVGDVRLIQ